MRLEDKTAIVTGGASGFGAGIVRKFVSEGAQVMIAQASWKGTPLNGFPEFVAGIFFRIVDSDNTALGAVKGFMG